MGRYVGGNDTTSVSESDSSRCGLRHSGELPSISGAAEEVDLAVISGEPAAATKKALEAIGGISRFVKKGQRVVLKPNMSFARTPEFAATTHPLVVATVAQACIDAGAEQVLVLDHTLAKGRTLS